jgi:uncharacterized MAPEG superfamily protein
MPLPPHGILWPYKSQRNATNRGRGRKKRQERREKKKLRTEGTTGEANETETGEENKRKAYPSFAFVFRTQTQ